MVKENVLKNQTPIKRKVIQRAEILVSLERFVYCRLCTVKENTKELLDIRDMITFLKISLLENKKKYPHNLKK